LSFQLEKGKQVLPSSTRSFTLVNGPPSKRMSSLTFWKFGALESLDMRSASNTLSVSLVGHVLPAPAPAESWGSPASGDDEQPALVSAAHKSAVQQAARHGVGGTRAA